MGYSQKKEKCAWGVFEEFTFWEVNPLDFWLMLDTLLWIFADTGPFFDRRSPWILSFESGDPLDFEKYEPPRSQNSSTNMDCKDYFRNSPLRLEFNAFFSFEFGLNHSYYFNGINFRDWAHPRILKISRGLNFADDTFGRQHFHNCVPFYCEIMHVSCLNTYYYCFFDTSEHFKISSYLTFFEFCQRYFRV